MFSAFFVSVIPVMVWTVGTFVSVERSDTFIALGDRWRKNTDINRNLNEGEDARMRGYLADKEKSKQNSVDCKSDHNFPWHFLEFKMHCVLLYVLKYFFTFFAILNNITCFL
jgi:hypothetical protein